MPQTIATPAHSDLIIKKSRFIGCVQPVANRAEAQAIVAALWTQHPGAAHVCWALLAGGQSAAVDDGEPGGTAGRPMLDVLRHQDMDGVLATVVRYYGGVKLGTGGLVRAYTDAIAQAMLGVAKIPIIKQQTLRCTVPYSFEGLLRRETEAIGAKLLDVSHGDAVELSFSLPENKRDDFLFRLNELGQGQIVWLPDT